MAERRRVLFVDHEPRLSGGERNLADLAEALAAVGVDVHVAVPARGPLADYVEAAGCRVHVVPMAAQVLSLSRWEMARRPWVVPARAVALVAAAVRIARLVRQVRPDVVQTTSQKAHVLTTPASLLLRVPHVWYVQDILERSWLRSAVAVLARVGAARVVCLSDATAAPWRRTLRARVSVIYAGVRSEDPPDEAVAGARAAVGAADGAPVVGIVGQIAHWKGQDVFVHAAERLAASTTARFAVIGACLFPANEGAFDAELRRRVREGPLATRLVFAGSVEPIAPVMAALDVLVHASRLPEPFGRVIVEAMAQGTPVVTTTIGAGVELVPPDAGLLVPPDDAVALADAIAALLEEDLEQRRARRLAAQRAAARFTPGAAAAEHLSLWQELTG